MTPLILRGDFVASIHRWLSRTRACPYRNQQVTKEILLSGGFDMPSALPQATQPPRYELMEIGETLYVTTRDEFRDWLIINHQTKKEIWLIQYKKATKKPSVNYVEAVEEAICFGWIDGFEKGMDSERYALRFSPRRPKSNWTNTNKERARKMIAEGRMTKAGRTTLPPDVQIR
jgi:hypothetical protein